MSFLFPSRDTERITEAAHIYVDRDDPLYSNAGAGALDRQQLLGSALRRAQNLSVSMYRTNPLANRIIRINTSFMSGTGFAIGGENPVVDQIVSEFWNAERNRMDMNSRDRARDFLLFGEGILPAGVDDTGNSTLGFIDPTTVKAIHRSPRSNVILESVELDTDWQNPDREALRVIKAVEDPADPMAGLLAGDVFVWLFDRIAAGTRGMPFLLPVMDWLDAYDQTLWELAERVKAVRAFFWDVEVDGGAKEIEEAQKLWGVNPPATGSVRFRTPRIRPSASQPQIGAYEDRAAIEYLLRHIAAGAGVAPHWLGDPGDTNRSTAESMDQPVLRSLVDIQTEWKLHIEQILRFVVDQKIAADMLPRILRRHDQHGRELPGDENLVPAHELVTVEVPQITEDKVAEAAASLTAVVQAFIAADQLDVIDRNVMTRVIRAILPSLGVPADELPDPDDDEDPDRAAQRLAQAVESLSARGRRSTFLDDV